MIDSWWVGPNYPPFVVSNYAPSFCIVYATIDFLDSAHISDTADAIMDAKDATTLKFWPMGLMIDNNITIDERLTNLIICIGYL